MSESLIFMLVIAGGAAISCYGVKNFLKSKESLKWPTVIGEITLSEVVKEWGDDADGGLRLFYVPKIEYQYTLDNRVYTSNKVTVADYQTSDPNHSRRVTSKYRLGQKVKVYYNPEDKNDAILEPGASVGSIGIMAAGLLFMIVGAAIMAFN